MNFGLFILVSLYSVAMLMSLVGVALLMGRLR